MTFSKERQLDDVGEQVVARIESVNSGVERHVLTYTVEMGISMTKPLGDDGNKVYKPIAQFVINAHESASNCGGEWGMDHSAEPRPGTAVYVSSSKFTQEIEKYTHSYFKIPNRYGKLIARLSDEVAVYTDSTDGKEFRLFIESNGIAYCAYSRTDHDDGQPFKSGVGDYVIKDDTGAYLDGDRQIRDISAMNRILGKAWSLCKDTGLVSRYLRAAADPKAIESGFVNTYWNADSEIYKKAFELAFGSRAFAVGGDYNPAAIADAKHAGKKAIKLSSNIAGLLKYAGVADEEVASGRTNGKKLRDLFGFETDILVKAVAAIPQFLLMPGVGYKAMVDEETSAGMWDGVNVYLNENLFTVTKLNELIGVLVHEHRHARSGRQDYDRDFVSMADSDIARLIGGER